MADKLFGFGESEVRRIAEVDRRVLGNAPGVRVGEQKTAGTLEPIVVELLDVPEPGSKVRARQIDQRGASVGETEITAIEHIAWPVGRHGFAVMPPELLGVLVGNLPAAPHIYATGTGTAASDLLTTSVDLSEFVDDYTVLIAGAGVDGGVLQTTIVSATATVATLATDIETDITAAKITVLAIAYAWVLDVSETRQLIQRLDANGEPIKKPVVNRFRHISPPGGTLIGFKWWLGEWRLCESDCDVPNSEWEWPASSS